MVHLEKVSEKNWHECIDLPTGDDHQYVASNLYSIAEAQFYPETSSCCIYDDDKMIGYTLFGPDKEQEGLFFIDRLMIAEPFRKKGYGKCVIEKIIREAKEKGYKMLSTSSEPENRHMRGLLEKLEFYTEDEIIDGELVYYYNLK